MRRALLRLALVLGLQGAGMCLAGAPAPAASAPAPAASSAAGIPFKRDPESGESTLARTALALLACLAAGGAAVYLLRGRVGAVMPLGRPRRLQVLETQRLGVKSALVLVRWDGEELLLAQGERETTLVARAPARPAPGAEAA